MAVHVFPCRWCGKDMVGTHNRVCRGCRWRKRLADRLGDEHGRFPPQIAAALEWMLNNPDVRWPWVFAIPQALANYVRSCTHGNRELDVADFLALDHYRSTRRWVAAFCAIGLLPLDEVAGARVLATYRRRFASAMHPDDDRLIREYLHFDFLPWLRTRRVAHAEATITHYCRQITHVAQFLQRLRARNVSLASCELSDLEAVLRRSHRNRLQRFLGWAGGRYHHVRAFRFQTSRSSETPLATQDVRMRHIRRLADDQYPVALRFAAALLIVFGQNCTRIVLMRRGNVVTTGSAIHLYLAKAPITLPKHLEPLARWACGGNPHAWLFPDHRYPHEPISADKLRYQLRDVGLIDASMTLLQSTAVATFLQSVPIALAVDALGASSSSCARIAKLVASPSYAHYIGLRTTQQH